VVVTGRATRVTDPDLIARYRDVPLRPVPGEYLRVHAGMLQPVVMRQAQPTSWPAGQNDAVSAASPWHAPMARSPRVHQESARRGVRGRLSLARVYIAFSPSIRASPVVGGPQLFLCATYPSLSCGK
jgi:hypothetical protein